MNVENRHLAVFLAVAQTGSFSRAAERLHLTQPAVSGQIQRLERQLRTRLFERTSRPVALTEDGERLLPVAIRAVSALTEVERTMNHRQRPVVRLSVESPTFSRIVPRLRDAHPAVDYEVTVDLSEHSIAGLRSGSRHIAQVYDFDAAPLNLRGLAHTVLVREPNWVVLPRHHRLAGAPEVHLRDLATDRWLVRPPGDRLRQLVLAACQAAGFEARAHYTATDSTAVEHLIADEGCVTLGSPINQPSDWYVLRPLAQPVERTVVLAVLPGAVPAGVEAAVRDLMLSRYRQTALENNPEYHRTLT